MSIFVISDVHGNYDGLVRALEKKGIIDKHGNRQLSRKHKVISIGDLCNCVAENNEGDHKCLEMVGTIIDYLIVGNHEMPYFDSNNAFNGFKHYEILGAVLRRKLDDGLIIPAYKHYETLISHAGISRRILSFDLSLEEIYEGLNQIWHDRIFNHSWISSVGYSRGGRNNCGGILWCDFEDEFTPTNFTQIVGHTPRGVRMKDNSICIDVGAKNGNSKPFILEVK